MARKKAKQTGVQLGEDRARFMVLGGAAWLFAERGVRAVSVEDLLKAANLSRRTFYRIYDSKEDVMLALYRMGTDRLVETCRRAVEEEQDPLKLVERFIDAHLRNAREFSRLVFVLGGEAARQESLLHTRRMEAHATLVTLLQQRLPPADPLILRTVLLALEGVVRMMLEQGDEGRKITDESIARVRAVMMRIATAAVAGQGPGVAPIPPPVKSS
jgi:AcrR family transcriptional regulator